MIIISQLLIYVTHVRRKFYTTQWIFERRRKTVIYHNHIGKAKAQKDNYRNECDEAKPVYISLSEDNKQRGNLLLINVSVIRKMVHSCPYLLV